MAPAVCMWECLIETVLRFPVGETGREKALYAGL